MKALEKSRSLKLMKTKQVFSVAAICLLSFSTLGQSLPPSLTNGLVAYYPFEGNGNDASGSGNNATLAGNYQFLTNCLFGSGLRIIGDFSLYYSGGGHVMLPAFGSNMNSGYSLSLWVKDEAIGVEPVGQETYITFQPQNFYPNCSIWLRNISPPKVGFLIQSMSSVAFFDMNVDMGSYPNSWKQLALVSGPGKFACYFNGSKIYETNVFINNIFPAPYNALGRHWWDTGSSARMSVTYDNVRIYNRALTDQEVQQLYRIESTSLPYLTIQVKTIRLSLYVEEGKTYQLESSTDLQSWAAYGSPFVAFYSPIYQDVDVLDSYRFFRIREITN